MTFDRTIRIAADLKIRALLFDVDGILAETEELHRRAFNRAFADAGLAWTWDRETYLR
jgi:beta-phosphoglucomutase-like phosphatase (HAD superfamily)